MFPFFRFSKMKIWKEISQVAKVVVPDYVLQAVLEGVLVDVALSVPVLVARYVPALVREGAALV